VRTDIDTARLSALLRDVYSAPLETTDRAAIPHRLAAAFDAESCLIHTREDGASDVAIFGGTENCEVFFAAYQKNLHVKDEWHAAGSRFLGRAVLGKELVPESDFVRREWYNEVCRPCGIHYLVGTVFGIEPGHLGSLGIHRAPRAAPFASSDRATLDLLIPHLRQMLWFSRMADVDARARRLSFDTLAALSVGVFVVDGNCRIRLMNAAAERVAKTAKSVRVSKGRLSLSNPALDTSLRAAIRKASLVPLGRSLSAGETIAVPVDENASLPLTVRAIPPDTAASGPFTPLAAVFIGEPSRGALPSFELVRAMYGLTPAEMRVLRAVLNGERMPDYAAEAGISRNTANAQLKSVFAKTGCHRQADLVRKIAGDAMLNLSGAFARQ
jgi:DNA-binding CsgD family transcriptional regulator